jgi:hypothetical protein
MNEREVFKYDVFISHNSVDKPVVRELVNKLRQRDPEISIWFDDEKIDLGESLQDKLAEGLKLSRIALVLVGKEGLGQWEKLEVKGLIHTAATKHKTIIPVLLPGDYEEPELPYFLIDLLYLDMRKGIDSNSIEKLVRGITKGKPDKPSINPQTATIKTGESDHDLIRTPAGEQPKPGTWQRYRLWIVIAGVLLLTIGMIISFLLPRHSATVTPAVPVSESGSLPQTPKKPDIKAEPTVEKTLEAPPVKTPASAPGKTEPSILDILENKRLKPPAAKEEAPSTTGTIKTKPKQQQVKKTPVTQNKSVQTLSQSKKQQPKKTTVSQNKTVQKPLPPKPKPDDNNWLNDIHPVQVK